MKNIFSKSIVMVFFIFSSYLLAQQNNNADANSQNGEFIYKKKCLGCHGSDGKVKAFGVSRELTALNSKELTERLELFSDKRNQFTGGASGTMQKQVIALSKKEYDAVLDYLLKYIAAKN